MADFTGMTVKVTLKPPSSMVLQGVVKDVIPGQVLTLRDVLFLHNGSRCAEYSIRGPAIADLQVVDASSIPYPSSAVATTAPPLPMPTHPAVQSQPHAQSQSTLHAVTPQPQPANVTAPQRFVDPAILSYARSPGPLKTATLPPDAPSTPIRSMLAQAAATLPNNSSPFIGEAKKSQNGSYREAPEKANVPGIRQPDVPRVQVDGEDEATPEAVQAVLSTKKKTRRGQKKKPIMSTQQPPQIIDVEVSRNGNDMDGSEKRGKGWRQTPLLQPSPQTGSPHDRARTSRRAREEAQNGWATEDATDIQDMGDFDFEAAHKLFDKHSVFTALRQGDTTADEDRLVSHNKLPSRPGTYGGKNLHPTENVLSPKLGPLDSSSDADTELNFPSGGDAGGRSSSRHSLSRVALKKGPSRQNSSQVAPHPLSASISSDRGGLARSATSLSAKGAGRTVPSINASPLPSRVKSPISTAAPVGPSFPPVEAPVEAHLAIKPSITPCPVLLPSALETLEAETISRYGLTPEAIIETAGRSIAEIATSMFKLDRRRESRTNPVRTFTDPSTQDADPVVVIIVGNHPTGARALSAARHLLTRKTRLIVAETPPGSPETQDPHFRAHLTILKRLVKSGADIKRGPWRRAFAHIKNLPGPPAIIIDALLAGSTYDSVLDTSAPDVQMQAETREMIDWANRSRAPVLSVACPSGVSGFDGSTTVVEGEPLAIRPNRVISLGAPMRGLLDAAKSGERWNLVLADVGLNIALRREEAVAFGTTWIADVAFVEAAAVRAQAP